MDYVVHMRRTFLTSFTIFYLLSTISLIGLSFDVKIARANGYIDIRSDGSIYPSTVPISSLDNVTYTLTGNITCDYDGIIVFRDNIVIDGKGYAIHGTGASYSTGIYLRWMYNVTIRNVEISMFDYGIMVDDSSANIVGNNITNNYAGIALSWSSDNNIVGNNIMKNSVGIEVYSFSSNNKIIGNNIMSNNPSGISFSVSSNNTVSGNSIANNYDGIDFSYSSNNSIFHNNLVNNTYQVLNFPNSQYPKNVWDNGYPSGGNYWSNYNGLDLLSGPYQNLTESDGIGDKPYIVGENNQDHYPLMTPFTLTYYELLQTYSDLLANYQILNTTYHQILDIYTLLMGNYSQLQSDQKTLLSELNNIRNTMSLFIATTIIFVIATTYLAIRKPKIKTP
jgi:parallel beta-helix repeat protein